MIAVALTRTQRYHKGRHMKRVLRTFLTVIALAGAALLPGRVHAAPSTLLGGPLDASYFPSGSSHTIHQHMGNAGYTCFWAIDCAAAEPGFHSDVADDLGRTGGWAQVESVVTKVAVQGKQKSYTHRVSEVFGITVSSYVDGPTPYVTYPGAHGAATGYEGMTASQASYTDFNDVQQYGGFQPIDAQPQYVTDGQSTTLMVHDAPSVVEAGSFFTGDIDVEAVGICQHCATSQVKDMETRLQAALSALGSQA
jgi:hypothetical protein